MSTMIEVARRAGVSTATVSRVLSGGTGVRTDTQAKVLAAVHDLGYRPNRLPRYMRERSVRTIGLILSDIGNPFFTMIARGCEDAVAASGYSLILSSTDEDPQREERRLDDMAAERVAGVILASTGVASPALSRLVSEGIPVVALDRQIVGIELDLVAVDNEKAAHDGIRYLITLGHRRIGIIGGPDRVSAARHRLDGYKRAHRENRIPIDDALIRRGDLREPAGQRMADELLSIDPPPTAIFAVNNLTTIGVLRAVRQRGLRIPEDLSVLGFDDIPTGDLLDPPLSVIVQPTYQIGAKAAELVLRRAANPAAALQQVVLSAALIIRGSTGAPSTTARAVIDASRT